MTFTAQPVDQSSTGMNRIHDPDTYIPYVKSSGYIVIHQIRSVFSHLHRPERCGIQPVHLLPGSHSRDCAGIEIHFSVFFRKIREKRHSQQMIQMGMR